VAEEVIALDPESASAYITLAFCHIREVFFGWSKSRKESLEQALELAQKALSADAMKDLLTRIAQALVDNPEQVQVNEIKGSQTVD